MSKSRGFEDLEVWQKVIRLGGDVYKMTRSLPKEETYGLSSQMRRCVISISPNLAEGSARGSKKDFARFISIAIGSCAELKSQCFVACEIGYFTEFQVSELMQKLNHVGAMLQKLRTSMQANNQRLTIND